MGQKSLTGESIITAEEKKPEIVRKIFALTEGEEKGVAERLLTSEKLIRREPSELERIYFLDQTIFQGINTIANHVTAPGFVLESSDEGSKAKVRKFIRDIKLISILHRCVRHTLMFGNAYGEIIYNRLTPPTKLDDFVTIDPKTVDLIRETNGIPVLDDEGNFLGYEQTDARGQKKRFVKKELKNGHWPKIIHFNLYGLSLGHKGIGLIEPLYKSEKIKMNLEHSFGKVAYRVGLPIIHAKIGSQYHHPTDDQLKNFNKQLKKIHTNNQITTDETVEINLIQPKDISPLENVLNYFKGQVSSGLGVPELLLYGSGAGVNRATSEALLEQFFRNIVTYQAFFAEKIQILIDRFCELSRIEEAPRFIFKDPRPERLNDFAIRMQRYATSGYLTPSPLLDSHIRDLEGLPVEAKSEVAPEEELKKEDELSGIEGELVEDMVKSYGNLLDETEKALHKYGK